SGWMTLSTLTYRSCLDEGPAPTILMSDGEPSSDVRPIQPSWKLTRFGIGIPSPVGREGQGEGRLVRNSLRSSTVLAQFLTEESAGITNHESRITNDELRSRASTSLPDFINCRRILQRRNITRIATQVNQANDAPHDFCVA